MLCPARTVGMERQGCSSVSRRASIISTLSSFLSVLMIVRRASPFFGSLLLVRGHACPSQAPCVKIKRAHHFHLHVWEIRTFVQERRPGGPPLKNGAGQVSSS